MVVRLLTYQFLGQFQTLTVDKLYHKDHTHKKRGDIGQEVSRQKESLDVVVFPTGYLFSLHS